MLSFDALLQFAPLYFDVEICASFSVKVFGLGVWSISIRMRLEGPTPWHARGEASITLLFFDVDVSIDVSWGEPAGPPLPDVDVLPLLTAEIEKPENWRAFNPAGKTALVTIRSIPADEAALVLHPSGTLQIAQKLVPLEVPVSKLGNQRARDGQRFSLVPAAGGLARTGDVKERFAAAQFNDLDDAARLSAPAFEPMTGGIELTPAGNASFSAAAIKRANRYDLVTIDTAGAPPPRLLLRIEAVFAQRFFAGAAVGRSDLSAQSLRAKQPFAERVQAGDERFVIASSLDSAAIDGFSFGSEAEARARMSEMIGADPSLAGQVQVLPAFEAA
jgi:hypothetical protein